MNIWKAVSTLVLSLLIIVGGLTYFSSHFGWRIDTVLSGSMEPELKIGSVVITRSIPQDEIMKGDIITFISPTDHELTSHRVSTKIDGSPLYFETKGDANEESDSYLVPASAVEGKVVFSLPYIGYVTRFIKTPIGFILMMGLPGLIIIIVEIWSIWCAVNGRLHNEDTMLVES